MKEEKSNVKQATLDELGGIPFNQPFSSQELRRRVIYRLLMNTGRLRRPYHDTVLRYVRGVRKKYNVVCLNRAKSLYMKKEQP